MKPHEDGDPPNPNPKGEMKKNRHLSFLEPAGAATAAAAARGLSPGVAAAVD